MKTLYSKFIILPLIMIPPLIALSSKSIMFLWMLMEISSMAFIFYITLNSLILSKWESATTYFIIQSITSATLIPLMFLSNSNINKINLLINLILMIKLGLSPFHSWVPFLMNNLSWMNCFIMTTLQKIIPLLLLSKFMESNFLLLTSVISIFIASIMILKSSTLKKVMSYSSISNSGWIIFILNSSDLFMMIYLIIYTINTYLVFKMFDMMNINLPSDLNKLNININWMNKFILIFTLMSMAGLPPFMGFFMKFLAILSFKSYSFIMTPIIIMSLINLYSYLNMCWNLIFIYQTSSKPWMTYNKLNFNTKITFTTLTIMLMSFWILTSIFMIY